MASLPPTSPSNRVRIVVATSVMLTFISYWRAAAIVLNDLASSAFYACGIAEQAVGKSAPWFIVAVMLFSFAVRAVYVESCSMFVRGGVYRVVKEALGGTLAKFSVSALMFDYILTGPISGVSAGQYIVGLINEIIVTADVHGWIPRALHNLYNGTPQLNINLTSVVFALAVTIYYWWENTKGIQESSKKALRVMQITTVMVVILLGWSVITLFKTGYHPVPLPTPENLHFSRESLGFLRHSFPEQSLAKMFGLLGILIAFGHSVLAMSGEESLAQVNRELAHPKLKNLKKAAIIIALYSFIFTGLSALLSVMLIPDAVRVPVYKDNLISTASPKMVSWPTGSASRTASTEPAPASSTSSFCCRSSPFSPAVATSTFSAKPMPSVSSGASLSTISPCSSCVSNTKACAAGRCPPT